MKGVVALAVTAFVAQTASSQSPRIHDSAGVRIIENGPRLKAPVLFKLGDTPVFDYGGLQQDPADELSTRNGYSKAIRLRNGNVVIPDVTRVWFFDASGKRIKVIGRDGDGPGEFRQTTDVCATHGDTVLVGQSRRPLTKLTSRGEFVGTIALPNGGFTEGDICFDDGTFVVGNRHSGGGDAPAVYRFTRAGATGALNVIVDHEYPPYDMLVPVANPKGARGSRMYFANGNAYEIKAYDLTGKLAEIIRSSDPLLPLTNAEKSRMPLRAFRAGSTPAEIEEARRRAIDRSHTKFWPTMGNMLTDLSGRIWVEDWLPDGDATKARAWTAFDATGRLVGRLIIPGAPAAQRRFVVSFGKDEVFFARLDDDGARHITSYPILPVKP